MTDQTFVEEARQQIEAIKLARHEKDIRDAGFIMGHYDAVHEHLLDNHEFSVQTRLVSDPEFKLRYEAAQVVFAAKAAETDAVIRRIMGIFTRSAH